jgi:hypothetical protein
MASGRLARRHSANRAKNPVNGSGRPGDDSLIRLASIIIELVPEISGQDRVEPVERDPRALPMQIGLALEPCPPVDVDGPKPGLDQPKLDDADRESRSSGPLSGPVFRHPRASTRTEDIHRVNSR